MLSYPDALETIINCIQTLDTEEKTPAKADGQVVAGDIYSDYSLPIRDTSQPDGYAVRAADISSADKNKPVTLEIIDTVRAGYVSQKTVRPGTAIRIMTGSVVPDGADCVVRFEDTDEPAEKNGPNPDNPASVKIYVRLAPGANITKAGSNIQKGNLLVPGKTLIGPAQIAAMTATGIQNIKVILRPKVAIITTGDELIKIGSSLVPGKAYNSNEAAIESLVKHYGGIPKVMGVARDDEKSLIGKIQAGLAADALITTGGVSRGDYDLVRRIIEKIGKLIFFRIKMGPGAAFAFGLAEKSVNGSAKTTVPIFALSGPPQACMINFETLVRPALLKMRGIQEYSHPAVEAISEDSINNTRPMDFVRWTVLKKAGSGYAVTQSNNNSVLAQIATANSLTIIPAGTFVKPGDKIQVLPLDWCC